MVEQVANRCCESLLAASRILARPLDVVSCLCVQVTVGCPGFPSAGCPFSTGSASGWPRLRWLSTVVRPFPRYYAPVRPPKGVHVESAVTDLPRPGQRLDAAATSGVSLFPCMKFAYMPWLLRLREPSTPLALSRRTVLPSLPGHWVGDSIALISELYRPACTPPVNASPPPSRRADA